MQNLQFPAAQQFDRLTGLIGLPFLPCPRRIPFPFPALHELRPAGVKQKDETVVAEGKQDNANQDRRGTPWEIQFRGPPCYT